MWRSPIEVYSLVVVSLRRWASARSLFRTNEHSMQAGYRETPSNASGSAEDRTKRSLQTPDVEGPSHSRRRALERT